MYQIRSKYFKPSLSFLLIKLLLLILVVGECLVGFNEPVQLNRREIQQGLILQVSLTSRYLQGLHPVLLARLFSLALPDPL